MSPSEICTRCGQVGHTASSCKRPLPPAPHKAEQWDGTDTGMHKCQDCTKRMGCKLFVPSITQPVRCADFRAKGWR